MKSYLDEYLDRIDEFAGMTVDEAIKSQMPFIINTISRATGRYVSLENSEELSIGLLGLAEAIERYDQERGSFLPFARLVITSRVYNYLKKENKYRKLASIQELQEKGINLDAYYTEPTWERDVLAEEISIMKEEINQFGFDFTTLVKESPKHRDTRQQAIAISEKASREKEVVDKMYNKKKLPTQLISELCSVTKKVINRSKRFIIFMIIVFFRDLRAIKSWIER